MRIILLIAFSVITKQSLAQMDTIRFATDSLTLGKTGFYQATFSPSTKVNARFDCSNGFTGYTLIIDSNNTFFKNGFSCYGQDSLDNGTWKILGNSDILLESDSGKCVYQIFKLDDLYFLIEEQQVDEFIADIHNGLRKYANIIPFMKGGKQHSVYHNVGEIFIVKYFIMKQPEE